MAAEEKQVSQERYEARVNMASALVEAFAKALQETMPVLNQLDPQGQDHVLAMVSAYFWSAAVVTEDCPALTEEGFVELAREWWRAAKQAHTKDADQPRKGGA